MACHFRGKSGLRRTAHGVIPLRRKARNSGTEKMSKAMILRSGTGDLWGAVGVKIAKLCAKQGQIGKHEVDLSTSKCGSH